MASLYDDDEFFTNYYELRQDANNYNDNIEQPIMHTLIGNCSELNVLDIGCGYGNTCLWMKNTGAKRVRGIDISTRMIDYAKKHNAADGIVYNVLGAEEINQIDEKFDLIVSSLAFHYIKNFDKLIADISAHLHTGGRLVFSMEHPVYTACMVGGSLWLTDENNCKTAFLLDHYGIEGVRNVVWLNTPITKYHRKTSTIINILLKYKFRLTEIEEPSPTKAMMQTNERTRQELHRPAYLIIAAKKYE